MMCYSYAMGMDESIFELKKSDFNIERDGADNYTVSFNNELAGVWEDFVCRNLKIGYWNEYLTEFGAVFIFNLENGFKRYEANNYLNDEALQLCERLCGRSFESIKSMLSDNHFYNEVIADFRTNIK